MDDEIFIINQFSFIKAEYESLSQYWLQIIFPLSQSSRAAQINLHP